MERTAVLCLRDIALADIESVFVKENGGPYRQVLDTLEIAAIYDRFRLAHVQRGAFPRQFIAWRPKGIECLSIRVKP